MNAGGHVGHVLLTHVQFRLTAGAILVRQGKVWDTPSFKKQYGWHIRGFIFMTEC